MQPLRSNGSRSVPCVIIGLCWTRVIYEIGSHKRQVFCQTMLRFPWTVFLVVCSFLWFVQTSAICPAGMYYDAAWYSCADCPRGGYQPVENTATSCISCPLDTYASVYGSIKCTLCPNNAGTDHIGSYMLTHCQCPVGHFWATPWGTCTLCGPGSYNIDSRNVESCPSICPVGTHTNHAGTGCVTAQAAR
jgi:hypothetical protein